MFIWSIDVCIDICRYVYGIYILYTGNYIHIHAIMDLKVGELWSWHFCFADLFFCQTKMTKDPFLQVFLECRNPTMSSTLPSLIVLGTQRIPTISVSKSRPEPELQKSPKFGALLQFDQFATVGFSNVFQVATFQDKCGTCGGSWCQCLWFNNRGPCWWRKGATIETSNLEALSKFPSKIIFWDVVQMSTVIFFCVYLILIYLFACRFLKLRDHNTSCVHFVLFTFKA